MVVHYIRSWGIASGVHYTHTGSSPLHAVVVGIRKEIRLSATSRYDLPFSSEIWIPACPPICSRKGPPNLMK